ncbi:outer membrane beta-barrel protein [Microbulbifer sp.]|uniref:outer membrane beta-barrel protein n=1 Tax=Microbulbifer sp. TaxID=1908541 RepID=UPI00258DF9FD|nr:outer membrane beta-barrel protein [Microbulbifer sp.]
MARLPKLLVVSAALLATPASADFYSHRYLGLSALDGSLDGFCTQATAFVSGLNSQQQSASGTSCEEQGNGWKVYGGWRWKPNLAIELDLRQLPNASQGFQVSNPRFPAMRINEEITSRMGNAFVVAHLPFGTTGLSLFGKVGGGFWLRRLEQNQRGEAVFLITGDDGAEEEITMPVSGQWRENQSGFHWGYGAGVSYRHHNRWTLRAEWELFPEVGSSDFRGEQDIESASLGWSMHF